MSAAVGSRIFDGWLLRAAQAAAVAAALSIGCASAGGQEKPGISSADAMELLKQGNIRFAAGTATNPNSTASRAAETAKDQKPFAIILTCSDSRIPVERVFDRGIGDLFVVRIAGNVSDPNAVGSIEYGAEHLGSPLLVVMGHTRCGAVSAACTGAQLHGSIPGLVNSILPAVEAATRKHPGLSGKELVPFAVEENVWQTIAQLLSSSPDLQARIKAHKLQVVGAIYDITTTRVKFLGEHPEQTVLLDAKAAPPPEQRAPAPKVEARVPEAPEPAPVPSTEVVAAHPPEKPPQEFNANLVGAGDATSLQPKLPVRPAYGLAAGKPSEFERAVPALQEGPELTYAFGAAAAMALVATLFFAFRLSAMPDGLGGTRRALTLGTRLTLGLGALCCAMLAACALAANAERALNNAKTESQDMAVHARTVAGIQSDMMAARSGIRRFLETGADENLREYSDAIATAAVRIACASNVVQDPVFSKHLADMSTVLTGFDSVVLKLIPLVDERNSLVQGPLRDVSTRAASLLESVSGSAHNEGEPAASNAALRANLRLHESRGLFYRFLDSKDAADAKAADDSLKTGLAVLGELDTASKHAETKQRLADAGQAFRMYAQCVERCVRLGDQSDQLVKESVDAIVPRMLADTREIERTTLERQRELAARANRISIETRFGLIALSGGAALVALVFWILLTRATSAGVRNVLVVLRSIATGDLTQPPINSTSKDELGEIARVADRMSASIRDVITEVTASTTEVSNTARQIALSSEHMSASVAEVSRRASQASANAAESGRLAQAGGEVLTRTLEGMHAIGQAVASSNQSVFELGKRGEQIDGVISVISDIAEQANLLALNAAIEAAKAGANGRGFTMLSDELRKLAEQTTRATEEVGRNIRNIQQETRLAAERMGQGSEQVKAGVELAAQAESSLRRVIDGAIQVSGVVQAMGAASEAAGAGSSQSAAAASQLVTKAEQLMTMVSRFKLDGKTFYVSKSTGGVRIPSRPGA